MKITMPFEAPRPQSLEYTIDSYWKILTKNLQGLTKCIYAEILAYPKIVTQDPGLLVTPETRDPWLTSYGELGTRDPRT